MRLKLPAHSKTYSKQLFGWLFGASGKIASRPAMRRDGQLGLIQLVGAGPGDPELLTLKALKAIRNADVILHDRLVGPEILAMASARAEIVYVGKIGRGQSTPQSAIEARMIAEAQAGKRVVRLKGGDPFIFGRGGEEADAARAVGIPVEVVPGVSAALGAAANLQIPLTHRDHAQTLIFATGHCKEGGEPNLDWRAMANDRVTVAIYMGIATSGLIADRLIEAGRDPATPVVIIENATLPNQKVVRTRLERATQDLTAAGIAGPAILLIGEAVASADECELAARAGMSAQNLD